MNFGPLSNDGGYRRLNVAITRAKFSLTLVGSIMPTDISLERTNSEGVRLLRSYIDYAINGPQSLANEPTFTGAVNIESPFEEAVYNFLTLKGYCSDCGRVFPLVELQPDPLVRETIKRYISGGTLDFKNSHLDGYYCPCHRRSILT